MTAQTDVSRPDPSTTGRGRLTVDWTRCDGHGLCAGLLPAAVHLDEWGYPILDFEALAKTPAREITRAVSVCPALALRVERG